MAPFRLTHQAKGWIEPDYGGVLTSANFGDPCSAQGAGGVSRWMAVPWQADTASCRSGYDTSYDPYVPTFWPAHVPNQVLSQRAYETVMNEALPMDVRLSAFAKRAAWIRPLGNASYIAQINSMINDIGQMGIVEVRAGPTVGTDFPATMEVEQLPSRPAVPAVPAVSASETMLATHVALSDDFEDIDLRNTDKARHLSGLRHKR